MFCIIDVQPPWRNGLACWTSNSKVVGSSPTGGGNSVECFFFSLKIDARQGNWLLMRKEGNMKYTRSCNFQIFSIRCVRPNLALLRLVMTWVNTP